MNTWTDRRPLGLALVGCACFLPLTLVGAQLFAYLAVLGVVVEWVRGRGTNGDPPHLRREPVWIGALLYAGLCLASLAHGPRPELTLDKAHRLFLLLLIPAVTRATREDTRLPGRLADAFLAAAALRGVYDLVRFPLHVWVWDLAPPDFGNMRDPQIYVAAFLLGLARSRAPQTGLFARPWPHRAALALCLLGVVLHQKRGVWLALGILLPLLALLWRRRTWLALFALGAALLVAFPVTRARLSDLGDIWNPRRGDRALLWQEVAPRLIAEHPWGIGFKALTHADLKAAHRGVQADLDHLHNNWLQITVELGWPGVTLWTLWMLSVQAAALAGARAGGLPAAARALAAGVAAAHAALLLNGMVESNFGDNEIFMLFQLLAGLALVRAETAPPPAAD